MGPLSNTNTLKITCLLIYFSIAIHLSSSFTIYPKSNRCRSIASSLELYKDVFIQHRRSSSSLSLSSKSNQSSKSPIKTSPRVIAAQALIEKPSKKNINNTNNPVTKLEKIEDFHLLPSKRDKSFTRNLVSTTTRRKGQIDAVLSRLCDKYPPKCGMYTGVVMSCMRMGTAQVLFMDVKDFAAVSETVSVMRHQKFRAPERLIKFVNAILRRVVREGKETLEEHTSSADNVIPWLLHEWNESYGKDITSQMIEQILSPDGHQHVDLSLNVKPLFLKKDDDKDGDESYIQREKTKGIMSDFESRGNDHGEITLLPNNSLRVKRGIETIVANFPSYEDGKWWVQDVSSTLPALGLISALYKRGDDISKLHVVDMCAAPGGKTSQLLAAGFGKVTAIEANERRSRLLRENLDRLDFEQRCEVVVSPGQDWVNKDDNEVAAILVDVPCSATGTGNRRPDVLQKDTSDLEQLHEIQEILANHCVDNILSKDGIMIYATCSLLKSESEDQVTKLLERDDVTTLPFERGEIPGFDDAIDENGWLRIIPGRLGGQLNYCDGFFVARLTKR